MKKNKLKLIIYLLISIHQRHLFANSANSESTRIEVADLKGYHSPIVWQLSLSNLKSPSFELKVPWPEEVSEQLEVTAVKLTPTLNPKEGVPLPTPRQKNNELVINIPAPSRLYVGSTRLLQLTLKNKKQTPQHIYLVPLRAVGGFNKTSTFLLVENQGEVERIRCLVLQSFNDQAVILSRVPSGARLIIAGHEKIYFSKKMTFHEVTNEFN